MVLFGGEEDMRESRESPERERVLQICVCMYYIYRALILRKFK